MGPAPNADWPHQPDLAFEQRLWAAGLSRVAGIDEAGRGALAGPVAVGAVVLPPDPAIAEQLAGVRDSKQMTAMQRERWAQVIQTAAAAWSVAFASVAEIDQLGIAPAVRLAAGRAVHALGIPPQHLLIDWLRLPAVDLPQTALVKGDCRVLSIAAASVLAKTTRDAEMVRLETLYPGYGLAVHKGYGTPQHRLALHALGPTDQHRRSFRLLPDAATIYAKEQI